MTAPRYRQLAEEIRQRILTGELAPGAQLPGERALVVQYGVSRRTVRDAIALLRADGLVAVRQGAGAYVREIHEVVTVTPRPTVRITARMPTAAERDQLELDDGVPVLVVQTGDDEVRVYPADRTAVEL
jgi:DNA-binding FadR family transcriptional regulator